MPRVLIVSPHFPPSNAPDMQRVRLVLPYLKEAGWDADVLAVCPDQVAAPRDDWLLTTLPLDVPIHRVKALSLAWGRLPGLGSLAWRTHRALRLAGSQLLQAGRFDLVYFSTTQFGLHTLGPWWKRHHGVPFTMDLQDPWVNDYYCDHPEQTPPGGRLKYAIADRLNRAQEPRVLAHCAGITSVSAAYLEQVRRRYPWLRADLPTAVMTFPADERDFASIEQQKVGQTVFDPEDGKIHWIYVGRGGMDMHRAARGLFNAVSSARSTHDWINRLRIHLIGTSYAEAGRGIACFTKLADECGIADLVVESTDRIPYSSALRCLRDADALCVIGSDDSGYTASKLYPYLLAGKPLLGILHAQSSATAILEKTLGGVAVTFDATTATEVIANSIRCEWIDSGSHQKVRPLVAAAFAPYHASNQVRELTLFWQQCLDSSVAKIGQPPLSPTHRCA